MEDVAEVGQNGVEIGFERGAGWAAGQVGGSVQVATRHGGQRRLVGGFACLGVARRAEQQVGDTFHGREDNGDASPQPVRQDNFGNLP